jgi:hypothetical protein
MSEKLKFAWLIITAPLWIVGIILALPLLLYIDDDEYCECD